MSAYSTEYAQLRERYNAHQQELRGAQDNLMSFKFARTWFAVNGTTPRSKSNRRPLRSGGLKALS